MLNNLTLMGRLVSDPELKTTPAGRSVTSVTIAVDRNYKSSDGKSETDFIPVIFWGKTAEFVTRYFGKGAMIAVTGRIQSRTYQAKDGTNRTVIEVVANEVNFTGERRTDTPAPQPAPATQTTAQPAPATQTTAQPAPAAQATAQAAPAAQYQQQGFEEIPLLDNDLPF